MRLHLLKASLFALLLIGFAAPAIAESEEDHFTHGPILGRLSAHGIGVWGRTVRPTTFHVKYGTVKNKLDKKSKSVTTKIEDDCTGWVHIEGLKANTKYYYELVLPQVKGPTGRVGSFTTLPDSKEYVNKQLNPQGLFNFSFEFACGNNQNPGHSSGPGLIALKTARKKFKDKIHFAILNGDWLYETQRMYQPEQWQKQTWQVGKKLPKNLQVAPTTVGVWQNYKHFLNQSTALQKWHAEIPSFFTYDDHEMLNDVWGAGTPGLRDRRAVFRDIGVAAWYDYLGWSNPTTFKQGVHFGKGTLKKGSDILVDNEADFTKIDLKQANNLHVHWGTKTAGVNDNALDGVGGVPNAGVYRIVKVLGKNRVQISPSAKADGTNSYSIGRRSYYKLRIANCDLFICDTRGQRQMHDTKKPYQKGLSMLGPVQRKWLLEGTKNSDADFIFVVSSVNFMVPHVGGGKVRGTNKDDAWTVFFDERETLINAWDKLDKPVMVLTGDLHNSFVIKITDNVWEMASGPHNSNNHWAADEGNRPANGKFKYGPRACDIRWSTYYRTDIPRSQLLHPNFCVVQINNVFNNPKTVHDTRWVAFPRPQVIFKYYNGRTGKLKYAESVLARPRKK